LVPGVGEAAGHGHDHGYVDHGFVMAGQGFVGLLGPPTCSTIVAMAVEPLRKVRDHLSDFVDRGEREHERVVVTRNGRPAAVLIGYEDLGAIEETLEILSDGEAMADIREAREEVARGEVIEGVDAVRALRPRP
jgi:antitoxin YefM